MDPELFTELYRRHHRAVWAYGVRRLPAAADAADVAAEVFAVAWRRRDDLPPEPETLLWLYGTARRPRCSTTSPTGAATSARSSPASTGTWSPPEAAGEPLSDLELSRLATDPGFVS